MSPIGDVAAVAAIQVLCIRSMRCKACVVDPGGPGAPRTEKTTTQDCIMLSPHNQVYHEPQTSQVPCYYHPVQLNEVSRLKSTKYSSFLTLPLNIYVFRLLVC